MTGQFHYPLVVMDISQKLVLLYSLRECKYVLALAKVHLDQSLSPPSAAGVHPALSRKLNTMTI